MKNESYLRAKQLSKIHPLDLLDRYTGHSGSKLKVKYRMPNRKENKEIYIPEELLPR